MSQPPTPRPGAGRPPDDASPARPKKPYVKPAFVREAVFETTALSCGKINPTVRQCNLVRKNS
jgi:hypothetical protein